MLLLKTCPISQRYLWYSNYWLLPHQNYLDNFGFLDAALDREMTDNSMKNDGNGDGNNIRANPIRIRNVGGKLS